MRKLRNESVWSSHSTCTQQSELEAGFYNTVVIKPALSFLVNMAKIAVIDPNLEAGQEQHFLMLQPLTAPHFWALLQWVTSYRIVSKKKRNSSHYCIRDEIAVESIGNYWVHFLIQLKLQPMMSFFPHHIPTSNRYQATSNRVNVVRYRNRWHHICVTSTLAYKAAAPLKPFYDLNYKQIPPISRNNWYTSLSLKKLSLDISAHIIKLDINISGTQKGHDLWTVETMRMKMNPHFLSTFQVCAYPPKLALSKFKQICLKSGLDRKFHSYFWINRTHWHFRAVHMLFQFQKD